MPVPNAWFSKLRADGVIASGNAGIWVTALDGTAVQVSEVGTMPIWAGQTLVYNRNDGTTQIGLEGDGRLSARVSAAYNEYVGCDGGQWAGVVQGAAARVDRYNGPTLIDTLPEACLPQFWGLSFGYVRPYPKEDRELWIGGTLKATGKIVTWCADRAGASYVYAVATSTYTKHLIDNKGNDVTIRGQQDETPRVVFTGLDGYPHVVSELPNGLCERMIYSAFGYYYPGVYDNADARIIGSQGRIVASEKGQPRHLWIDFAAPKVDLRLV